MITIRHIDRTCLVEDAYKKLIDKFSYLEKDILIVFDLRIATMGVHQYDSDDELHTIRISPVSNSTSTNEKNDVVMLDKESEKFQLISTTLHELQHAMSREALGKSFYAKKYFLAKVKNKEMQEYWSKCEVDARKYELDNIFKAMEYYNGLIK
jgi:hypothetical protein